MKKWLKIILFLFIIGIIGAVMVYIFVYNKPHRDIAKAKPDFTLTASDFYTAFMNDPDGSAQLYNDKVIQIDGTIGAVESTTDMVILVYIFNDGMFGSEGVRCTLLREMHADAASINSGDYLKIKGLCTGLNGSDVILEKCSVIK